MAGDQQSRRRVPVRFVRLGAAPHRPPNTVALARRARVASGLQRGAALGWHIQGETTNKYVVLLAKIRNVIVLGVQEQ